MIMRHCPPKKKEHSIDYHRVRRYTTINIYIYLNPFSGREGDKRNERWEGNADVALLLSQRVRAQQEGCSKYLQRCIFSKRRQRHRQLANSFHPTKQHNKNCNNEVLQKYNARQRLTLLLVHTLTSTVVDFLGGAAAPVGIACCWDGSPPAEPIMAMAASRACFGSMPVFSDPLFVILQKNVRSHLV